VDCAFVLGDDLSIRVEELLIIRSMEAITVNADRIQFPQLEPYALWVARDTTGSPSHVEELEGSGAYLCPSPQAYRRCKIWGLDFQSVTMPLRVSSNGGM
jgi:hypothetical protein